LHTTVLRAPLGVRRVMCCGIPLCDSSTRSVEMVEMAYAPPGVPRASWVLAGVVRFLAAPPSGSLVFGRWRGSTSAPSSQKSWTALPGLILHVHPFRYLRRGEPGVYSWAPATPRAGTNDSSGTPTPYRLVEVRRPLRQAAEFPPAAVGGGGWGWVWGGELSMYYRQLLAGRRLGRSRSAADGRPCRDTGAAFHGGGAAMEWLEDGDN